MPEASIQIRGQNLQDSRSHFAPQPFFAEGSIGAVVHATSDRVIVESQGRHRSVPTHGFGLWTIEPGDEVALGKDVDGAWKAFPAVTTVADLPVQTAATSESLVRIGGLDVRITDSPATQVLRELARTSPNETIQYLLIKNVTSGELRLWGVFRNSRPNRASA